MRKTVAVLFSLVCLAHVVGCGDSSTTSTVTTYDTLPTPFVSYSSVLGGRIPRGALSFTNYSVSTVTGSSAGFSNHSTVTSPPAKFNRPMAVTCDGPNLYVADYLNNAIRKIVIETGVDTTIAGNIAGLAGSADGTGVAASFNLPSGITTDGTSLYVTDSGNYTIRKIVISSGVVTTLAGAVGSAGSMDAPVGTNARFNLLNGITTDGISLYVTDSNNTIRRVVLSSATVPSGPVTTLAGAPGTAGSADGAPSAARFNQPARLTTDGPNLYVTDFANSTIRKIVLESGIVSTIAGKAGPGGEAGSHVDSDTGQNARFNQPNGITTDGANLYVTDSYDNTVRQIVISSTGYSGRVTTIAGAASGPIGGSKDGVGAVATFNKPIGITTDGISLFITDNQNHTIRKIQ